MLQKINGRAIAKKIKTKIAKNIHELKGPRPNLAIILVGDREDSKIYVKLKESEGKKVGIDTHIYKMEEDTKEREIIKAIEFLNEDQLIDGILVQLPLPAGLNTDKIIKSIDPRKDVDGWHSECPEYIDSPVLAAVRASLEDINFKLNDCQACILYNSDIFGQGLRKVLSDFNLKIVNRDKLKEADVIVSALGSPHYLNKKMVKPGVVIIDIGITKKGDKVLGDADIKDLKNTASFITPVPGGIGPITVAFLFKNVWEIYRRRHKINL